MARSDIDEDRTAAMGGSFGGGYMANWVVGHTDRFSAIVTHASLWALDRFRSTTEASFYCKKEMALANSPHAHVEKISTPMLVIHGDKDFRVLIGEGLRLWYELLSRSQPPAGPNGETCTSRMRTTGSSSRSTQRSGTRLSSTSSPAMCWAKR